MSDETYHLALSNEAQIEILRDEIKELKDKIESLEKDNKTIFEVLFNHISRNYDK